MSENQSEQPVVPASKLAEPQISDEVAAFTVNSVLRAIESSQAATQSDTLRINASVISYLDRVVVVAGGALALVFTVIANLSVQLHSIHQSALHPKFVILSCWFFVSCITTGLLAGWAALKSQVVAAQIAALAHFESKLKTGFLDKYPRLINQPMPSLPHVHKTRQRLYRLLLATTTFAAYFSLIMAFAFLALFVQANISLLLIVR